MSPKPRFEGKPTVCLHCQEQVQFGLGYCPKCGYTMPEGEAHGTSAQRVQKMARRAKREKVADPQV